MVQYVLWISNGLLISQLCVQIFWDLCLSGLERTAKSKSNMKTQIRLLITVEQRIACLPDDLWPKWLEVYDMFFAHGAVGLKLKNHVGECYGIHDESQNRYRDVIFVLPHPVSKDRKLDVKLIRDTLFTLSYKVMEYLLDDILSGDILDEKVKKELLTNAKAKPLEFDSFWKNLVVNRIHRYLAWITIQYWCFLLCKVHSVKVSEAEENVFHFKLSDFSTWLGPNTPMSTSIPLATPVAVSLAGRSANGFIKRDVKDDWRPNVWQMEAMRMVLNSHSVNYIHIQHEPDGGLKVKLPSMWDQEDFPIPSWKPPKPVHQDMPASEIKLRLKSLLDAGGITQDPEITLNAERALNGHMLQLYNTWNSDIQMNLKMAKEARKGAVSVEAAARANAAGGLSTARFYIKTNPNPPTVLPSNCYLSGRPNPNFAMSENPRLVSFCCTWVLHIPVVLKSMGVDETPVDPPNPNKYDLDMQYSAAASHLKKIMGLLHKNEEVPAKMLPVQVRPK